MQHQSCSLLGYTLGIQVGRWLWCRVSQRGCHWVVGPTPYSWCFFSRHQLRASDRVREFSSLECLRGNISTINPPLPPIPAKGFNKSAKDGLQAEKKLLLWENIIVAYSEMIKDLFEQSLILIDFLGVDVLNYGEIANCPREQLVIPPGLKKL